MAKTTWQDLLNPGAAGDFFTRRNIPAFNPATGEYSRANALWLAELSRLVYRPDIEEMASPPQPVRKLYLEKAQLRQRRFFYSKETSTQAFLVEPLDSPKFGALVFRGTEQNPKDFISDIKLNLTPISASDKAVHEGFAEALDSVWAEINRELSLVNYPVFYTGHSLGAALATLAASRRAPKAVYTFGSPLVGNSAFVASIAHIPVHRVVDDQDAVTWVPPEILGYRHAGKLQLLSDPDKISLLDPRTWYKIWPFGSPPKPLADHAPVNYVDRIIL
ncbi:MAG: hypothetical protein OEV66_02860 [Spirochaetia bacterium]|nr:hypothetical protein [Spirochaetia bacterium]